MKRILTMSVLAVVSTAVATLAAPDEFGVKRDELLRSNAFTYFA